MDLAFLLRGRVALEIGGTGAMGTILCVSEKDRSVRTLESSLATDGHEVVYAPDRLQAIEVLLGRPFDAAVLFLGTRAGEVWQLIPLLRRVDRDLPVLTVAEEDSVETQREIRGLRVFYHLTEPVDASELREAIREALARRRAQR